MSWSIDYDIPRTTVLSFWFRWCLWPDAVSEPSESLCYNLRPHQTSTLLHDQLRPDHEPLRSFPGAAPTVMGSYEDSSFRRDFIFPPRHQHRSLPNPVQLYLTESFLLMVSLFSFIVFIASCRGLSTTIFLEELLYGLGCGSVCKRTQFQSFEMFFLKFLFI